MKVLLLGVGMQGKAALHDLVHSDLVTEILAADLDLDALRAHVAGIESAKPIRCHRVDASDPESLDHVMRERPEVVIDLLPVAYLGNVTGAAVRHKVHLVNTCYAYPEVRAHAEAALAAGITILPEFGFDPGIDVVLLGQATRSLDHVDEILSYGGGVPEPEAANNPLKYKLSWTFPGVLRAYRRAGRVIRDGAIVDIDGDQIFSPANIHEIGFDGLGALEAYPNGDVMPYVELLNLNPASLRHAGRYGLRWPGHCAFWKRLVDLGFLDDEPVMVDGAAVDRKRFLTSLIEPQIPYRADERDMVVIRVEAKGTLNGKTASAGFQVVDRRDLATGHLAMARTVGYTASIGAQMITSGAITKRGLISPLNDVPYELFSQVLQERGIQIESRVGPYVNGEA